MHRIVMVAFSAILGLSGVVFAEPGPAHAANFRLTDHQHRSWELHRYPDAPAIVIATYAADCAGARNSAAALEQVRQEFEPKGVIFFLLDAEPGDTRERIGASLDGISAAPVLTDPVQRVARMLGFTHTAQAILIAPAKDWSIIYRGPADIGGVRGALAAHTGGLALPEPQAAAEQGTPIAFAESAAVSYSKDIAPILERNCVNCHTSGGIAPFAMDSHRKVKGWASMMREVILTKRMPPWHADPHFGAFENARGLPLEDERALLAWLEAGAPKDESESDPLVEARGQSKDAWAFGEPDLVVAMPSEEKIPAEGEVEYRYSYVPSGLTEDKWVRAAQVIPGNLAVLHHCLVFIMYPREYRHIQPDNHGGLGGYFEAYLPGSLIRPYPEGTGQFVPAGSTFVYQMHYTATGKEEVDLTKMGLYFHDERPRQALRIGGGYNTRFEIPPMVRDHPCRARYEFGQNAVLWGVSPHMHYRGSRARFTLNQAGAAPVTLLNVPFYEFDWQPMYSFAEGVSVPRGAVVEVDGAWDNSPYNPRNPAPDQSVDFGEQSWEEMFVGFIRYAVDIDDAYYTAKPDGRVPGEPITAENLPGSTFSLMGRFTFKFEPNGVLRVNDLFEGTWEIDGPTLKVSGMGRSIRLLIQDDELVFSGRAIARVPS